MLPSEEFYFTMSKYHSLNKNDLIYPIFIDEKNSREELGFMPGLFKIPISNLVEKVDEILNNGITSIMLFGIPRSRDSIGSSAFSENGVVQNTLEIIRSNFGKKPNLITDVCLCQYNNTGHCGITTKDKYNVENDSTNQILSRIALSHAMAGANVVAPSAMMDGQVKIIRETLDLHNHKKTKILSFSAKQSSSLYKPFRSEIFLRRSGEYVDKSMYQVSYKNPREALREIEIDITEGADMVMIKPALSSLDLIFRTRKICTLPIVVQVVSGEYSMMRAAISQRVFDEITLVLHLMATLKRSGADKIISYSSMKVSKYLR